MYRVSDEATAPRSFASRSQNRAIARASDQATGSAVIQAAKRLSCAARRQLEVLAQLTQHRVEPVDLGVRVRRRELDAEADLGAGHEGIGGHRHVDPALEE